MSTIAAAARAAVERLGRGALLDGTLADFGAALCEALGAERLTIYELAGDATLRALLQMGLDSFNGIRVPVSESSLAGYVALTRRPLNVADAYDEDELRRHSPGLRFLRAVDERTGFRTRQVLVAPLLAHREGGALIGVAQLLNSRDGKPFSAECEAAFAEVANLLAARLAAARSLTLDTSSSMVLGSSRKPPDFRDEDAVIGDMLSLDEPEQASVSDEVSAAADNELLKLVTKILLDADAQGVTDIHIDPASGREKVRVQFDQGGELTSYIEVPASYREALAKQVKRMSGTEFEVRTTHTAGGRESIVLTRAVRPGVPAIPVPITDDVHFTVTAPATVAHGRSFVLDVWAHLERDRGRVMQQATEQAAGAPIRSRTRGAARIEQGQRLAVRVSVPDFAFADSDEILWTGTTGNATFAIAVPEGVSDGVHVGTAEFAVDGVRISRLHFELVAGAGQGERREHEVRERRPRTAFASYASEDRDRVLGRIQGMQKLLPELDFFLDVASMRSGEDWARRVEQEIARREAFYLFWSAAACRSEWVEKEWRIALRLKGLAAIDPVPLDPPQRVPPPPELQSLHFNEWTLAFQQGD